MKVMSAVCPVLSLLVGGLLVAACGDGDSASSASVDGADASATDAGVETDSAAPGECEGKADGTTCGSSTSTECDGADTCKSGACEKNLANAGASCGDAPTACTDKGTCDGNGKCNGTPKAAGTECGAATSECSVASTCDGKGDCQSNFKAAGVACGSATLTDCTDADTCDGKGACKNNDKDDGTACGTSSDVACDRADTCLAGVCATNVAADGAFCQDCAAGFGKCGLCGAGACPDLCATPGTTSIETPRLADIQWSGNMFEVGATRDVMVLGIDVESWSSSGDVPLEIYTHAGALEGTTTDPSRWTLRQTSPINQVFGRTPLLADIFVPLTTGTNSVYITHAQGYLLAHAGTGLGNVVTDDGVLSIKEGYGMQYAFGYSKEPRIWSGAFRYVPGVTTSYAGGVNDQGEMFDVKATATTSIRALSVNLPPGDHTLRVYFHPGTFVGTEAKAAAWTAIGGEVAVKAGIDGGPTAIPLKIDVTIPAGTTYGFYVTTTGATSLNATAGTAVGTLASAAGAVEIYEGAGVAYPFGAVTKGRKPNVTVYHGNCE